MRWTLTAVVGAISLAAVGLVNAERVNAGGGAGPQPFLTPSLQGWEGLMEYWTYRGGVLTGSAPKGLKFNTFLCSKRKYKDFELSFQVKLTGANPNSGVQIRSEIENRATFQCKGPQCDMGQIYWGSLYGEHFGGMMQQAPKEIVAKALKKDDFNDYYIQCVGTHVTIKLNGMTTVADDFPKMPPEGIISFQLHSGGPMEAVFRNIQFLNLSESTPPTGTVPTPASGVISTSGPCDCWSCPPRRLFGRLRR